MKVHQENMDTYSKLSIQRDCHPQKNIFKSLIMKEMECKPVNRITKIALVASRKNI